jgi:hypothetical protein
VFTGGVVQFYTGGSERARIDSSGNVGIGTSSPSTYVNSQGTIFVTGSSPNWATIQSRGDGPSGAGNYVSYGGSYSTNPINGARIGLAASGGSGQQGQILFYTKNLDDNSTQPVERVRIDGAGNVGIGQTSITRAFTNYNQLNINGSSGATIQMQFGGNLASNIVADNNALYLQNISAISFNVGGTGTGTERARIDSSGNLLVGTTTQSNNEKVTIYQSASAVGISVRSNGGPALGNYESSDNAHAAYWTFGRDNASTGNFVFASNGSQKVAIDTSGRTLIGITASRPNGGVLQVSAQGQTGLVTYTTSTTSNNAAYFENGNGIVGTIVTNGTSTSYNTSSDYRLKEDWVAVADASTRVNALKPINFAWKVDGSRVDGFLAHELAEVVPEAVTGTKDAVDADGKPEYQGIDQSKLVPLLTAALQEALAKIESLEARLNAANI